MRKKKAASVSRAPSPVNAVLLEIQPASIRDALSLPGVVEAWTRLELMAKVAGSVEEIRVREGAEVKEGDVLVKIETRDYEIAFKRARAVYTFAKAEYGRNKTLHLRKGIPRATLESAETAMQTAKADLENAELMFSRCTVTAPMDGVIRRLDAKIGLFLSVGDPLLEMLRLDKLKGVVGIPESDISAVRKLSQADMTIKALDNLVVTGKKYFLSPAPETAARLYRLELEIDNSDGEILPGMFLQANIVKKEVRDALVVPFYSVISRNDEQYVFVAEEGLARKRQVRLGVMEGWTVQITHGLKQGEKILVEGHRDVEDGRKIKVVKTLTDIGNRAL